MENTVVEHKKTDWMTLAKAAATSMSSGLLLIIVGGSTPVYALGILFVILAIAFALAMTGIPWLSEKLSNLNQSISMLFLWIGIFSILRNWTQITTNMGSLITEKHAPSVLGVIFSTSNYLWMLLGLTIFGLLITFLLGKDLIKNIAENRSKVGKQKRMINIVAVTAGFIGEWLIIFPFNHVDNLLIIGVPVLTLIIGGTLVSVVYRSHQK